MTPTEPHFDPTGPLPLGTTLLEASAGTGKTYSITSIVLRLVIELGVDVDRILAVTFTNAATAELTSRIRKRLGEAHAALSRAALPQTHTYDQHTTGDEVIDFLVDAAHKTPGSPYPDRARRAVEAFDRAQISTIHGFCQRMLQQYALEAQVPFGVSLLEDQTALHTEIATDFWALQLDRLQPFELQLLELSGIDLTTVTSLVRTAITQFDATPTPAPPSFAALSPPDAQSERPDSAALVEAIAAAAEEARRPNARELVDALLTPIGTKARDIQETLDALDPLGRGLPSEKDRIALTRLHARSVKRPRDTLPPLVLAITRFLDEHATWRPRADGWILSVRHAIVAYARDQQKRRAKARGSWSFDDLLRRMHDALHSMGATDSGDTSVGHALQVAVGGRFDAVLIDEFQDTDPVQWAIFERLFKTPRHRLFLIGDPKQAIYSFRRADVNTYIAAKKTADRIFTLAVNRRSDPPLIAALNALFSHKNPARAFANDAIGYQQIAPPPERKAAAPRITNLGPPVRFLWIERTKKNAGNARYGYEAGRMTSTWAEAELPAMVASDIVRTLESNLRVASEGNRKVRPSDLAVLVPKNKQAAAMQVALRKLGVPAVVHGPYSVFATDEAKELERVLTAILDPASVRNVRNALLTRIIGVTASELATMDTTRGLEAWVNRLRLWREDWHKRSFIEGFRKLVSFRVEALLSLEDGERRLANLLQLGEILHLTASERGLKAPGLLAWYQRQLQRGDEPEKFQVRLETDEPAVQIITIHKAKGLEYPFVWCPFLWQSPTPVGKFRPSEEFVFRRRDNQTQLELGVDANNPDRKQHLAIKRYDNRAEQLRQLYVAITRAKHQVTLYAGAFWDLADSALGYLFFAAGQAHDAASLDAELTALQRLPSTRDAQIKERLAQVFDPTLITIESPGPTTDNRLASPAEPPALTGREFHERPIDTDWRRTSFSGLAVELQQHHPHHSTWDEDKVQAASDEDRTELTPEPQAPAPDLFTAVSDQTVTLVDLPSGRMIGNCIHKIFELHDFRDTRPSSLLTLVTSELLHFGIPTTHAPALTTSMRESLTTPLDATGFTLSELAPTDRLSELDFVFPTRPAPGFTLPGLAHVFRQHAEPHLEDWLEELETAKDREVRGFLSGSIDLVFQNPRDKRWYIIDWKSNHLGPRPGDYTRDAMRRAMDHHHYHLQYHLYVVALMRYLRHRMPGFDLERDFGGAYYLFIRGLAPHHPPGTGVYFDRPSPALIRALDETLAAQPGDLE